MGKSKSPTRAKLGRKGTMDQTIQDAENFLKEGTYDAGIEATSSGTILGKRKKSPVRRYEEPVSPTRKRSTSKSPVRKKAKLSATTSTASKGRSVSPVKSRKVRAAKPKGAKNTSVPTPVASVPVPFSTPKPTNKEFQVLWEYKSLKPAFGVFATNDRVWMSNDDGSVFGFTHDGVMERRIKLPSGVKTIVSDMGVWLYAGCDDGVVYDLSSETEPREAYRFNEFDTEYSDKSEEVEKDVEEETSSSLMSNDSKSRHIVFCIDKSGSMGKLDKIKSVAENMKMMLEHHLKEGDYVTLISFNNIVQTNFERVIVGDNDEFKKLRDFVFSPEFLSCNNSTAFYDALETSWNQFNDHPDEENWIIALTDGYDNMSKSASIASLKKRAPNDNANLLCVFVSRKGETSYKKDLSDLSKLTKKGLFIQVGLNEKTLGGGITSAFKEIAQVLSSKVMWMDIRDGLLSVSASSGKIVACSIEGNPIWKQQSAGNCGWMVRSDFEGVYHGHSVGVTKYDPIDGKILANVNLPDAVLYGWQDKTNKVLYVAAGNFVYQIDCTDLSIKKKFQCDATVVSTAASYGSEEPRIFVADNSLGLYCFALNGTRLWKANLYNGVALSMHYLNDRLFYVTTLGTLSCVYVGDKKVDDKDIKDVVVPKNLPIIHPSTSVEETSEIGDKVVIEIEKEFSDEELLEIHKNIHDTSVNQFTLNGKEYKIEIISNECRSVKINGLLYVEQNKTKDSKYAIMAKEGSKITWICNQGKWGLIIDDKVEHNGSNLIARTVKENEDYDSTKLVQFPRNLRLRGAKFVVDKLVLSESGEFYRIQGKIMRLK